MPFSYCQDGGSYSAAWSRPPGGRCGVAATRAGRGRVVFGEIMGVPALPLAAAVARTFELVGHDRTLHLSRSLFFYTIIHEGYSNPEPPILPPPLPLTHAAMSPPARYNRRGEQIERSRRWAAQYWLGPGAGAPSGGRAGRGGARRGGQKHRLAARSPRASRVRGRFTRWLEGNPPQIETAAPELSPTPHIASGDAGWRQLGGCSHLTGADTLPFALARAVRVSGFGDQWNRKPG